MIIIIGHKRMCGPYNKSLKCNQKIGDERKFYLIQSFNFPFINSPKSTFPYKGLLPKIVCCSCKFSECECTSLVSLNPICCNWCFWFWSCIDSNPLNTKRSFIIKEMNYFMLIHICI